MTSPTKAARPFKTLTDEGRDRKFNRIIAESLKAQHPDIYASFAKAANKTITRDNRSPLVPIMDKGLDTIHQKSVRLHIAQEKQKMALSRLTNRKGT